MGSGRSFTRSTGVRINHRTPKSTPVSKMTRTILMKTPSADVEGPLNKAPSSVQDKEMRSTGAESTSSGRR